MVKQTQQSLLRANKLVSALSSSHPVDLIALQDAKEERAAARSDYKKTVRHEQQQDCDERDKKMNTLLYTNSNTFFRNIKDQIIVNDAD